MKVDKALACLAAVVFLAASLIDWTPGLMAGVGRQTVVLLGLVAGIYWLIRIVIIVYQNGEAVAIGLIGCMLAVAAFAIVFSINHSPAQPAVAGGVSQNSPLPVVVTIGAPPAPPRG